LRQDVLGRYRLESIQYCSMYSLSNTESLFKLILLKAVNCFE